MVTHTLKKNKWQTSLQNSNGFLKSISDLEKEINKHDALLPSATSISSVSSSSSSATSGTAKTAQSQACNKHWEILKEQVIYMLDAILIEKSVPYLAFPWFGE